jgi:hypothetical protein
MTDEIGGCDPDDLLGRILIARWPLEVTADAGRPGGGSRAVFTISEPSLATTAAGWTG